MDYCNGSEKKREKENVYKLPSPPTTFLFIQPSQDSTVVRGREEKSEIAHLRVDEFFVVVLTVTQTQFGYSFSPQKLIFNVFIEFSSFAPHRATLCRSFYPSSVFLTPTRRKFS